MNHLDGGARRGVHGTEVAGDEGVLQVFGHRVQYEHGPQPGKRILHISSTKNGFARVIPPLTIGASSHNSGTEVRALPEK